MMAALILRPRFSRELYITSFRDCYLRNAIYASPCWRSFNQVGICRHNSVSTGTRFYATCREKHGGSNSVSGICACRFAVQSPSLQRYASHLSSMQSYQECRKYSHQVGLSIRSQSYFSNAYTSFYHTYNPDSFRWRITFLAPHNQLHNFRINSLLFKKSFHKEPTDERKILLDEKSKVEEFVDHQRKKREKAMDDKKEDAFIFTADGSSAPAIEDVQVAVSEKPKNKIAIIIQKIKDELIHYKNGFRLLFLDTKVCSRLLWQVLNGETLSRRERKQFLRTVADLFKLVPFMVFLIVPFMEFLLPVALWLFPGMLPSTFEDKSKREEKRKKSIKVKIQMAKFLQDTVEEISVSSTAPKSQEKLKDFADFVHRVRSGEQQPNNEDILTYSKLFEDEITLENLSHAQLKAICRLLMLQSIGTSNYLRFTLKMKLRELKADDKMIHNEGIAGLDRAELQQANVARGMRAFGVPEERLRSQLKQWLELSLYEEVPATLLLLSRALYIHEHLSQTDQLKATMSQLPERVVDEAEIKIGAIECEEVDRQTRIDIIEHEEEKIKEEKAAEEAEEAHKKKLREQEAAELLKEPDVTERDLADDLLRLKETLTTPKDELDQVREDRQEYQEDLKDLAVEVVDQGVRESTASSRLGEKVDQLIEKIDEGLVELEEEEGGIDIDADKDGVITTDDLFNAIRQSKDAPSEEKAREICELLDLDHDGTLSMDELRKAVDLIEKEDLDIDDEQVGDLMKVIKQSEDILVIEQIFAKRKSNVVMEVICKSIKK